MSEIPRRVLRDALRARDSAPSSRCLDADAIAAWADDMLPAHERRAFEQHAADCARCQALVAAMAKATPPPAPDRAWWRMPALAWLVPAVGAAIAVSIWVNAPHSMPRATATRAAVRSEPAPPAAASKDLTTAAPLDRPAPPSEARRARVEPSRQDAAGRRERDQRVASGTAASGNALDRLAGASALADAPAAPQPSARAVEPSSPPVATGAVAQAPAPLTASAAPAEASSVAPAPISETIAAPVARPAAKPQAPSADASPASNRALMAMKAAAPPAVSSPDGSTRWRIVPGGDVERSGDAGITWQPQTTGAAATLTAGAAASATTCWMIGPKGLVLLTTDGRTWRRVAAPDAADLAAIRAADETHATVTTVDGRTFTTADGGRTWFAAAR